MTSKINANNPIHQKTLRLQKRIFRSLKSEVQILLGKTPESIKKYEKENQRDFKSSYKSLTITDKSELISAVKNADVTFIADFHTFDQAQRTTLRIIREVITPRESWFIGLEFVASSFQKALDDFQMGKISLKSFHEKIEYQEAWGFPWENYSPIFEFAKEHQIRLIALNRPKAMFRPPGEKELMERDEWAAGLISDLFRDELEKGKHPRMIVLFGELHVGSKHLPYQLKKISQPYLKKSLKSITIHQNNDELYWRLAGRNRELQAEVIKLKPQVYCVFSSTPWAKLQSLVNWLEGDSPDKPEIDTDYLSLFQTYGNTISEFLGLSPPTYESLTLFTIKEASMIESLNESESFTSQELRLIRFHVVHNHRIYIPRMTLAYLGSPSYNGVAELAAIHLLKTRNHCKTLFTREEDDFYRLILESTFGFFGSLILNPRRKCDLAEDHLKRLKDLEQGAKSSFPLEMEARAIALSSIDPQFFPKVELKSILSQRRLTPALMISAKLIGKPLGLRLHQAILSGAAKISQIRELFFKNKGHTPFPTHRERYKELSALIAHVPAPSSKRVYL